MSLWGRYFRPRSRSLRARTLIPARSASSACVSCAARRCRRKIVPKAGSWLVTMGSVPIGAGLSSSAALEVVTGFALLRTAGQQIDLVKLAKLCQRAENEFVGARVGIMDQFIACLGEEAHCLMIDCRSLQYKKLPVPMEAGLVIWRNLSVSRIGRGQPADALAWRFVRPVDCASSRALLVRRAMWDRG